MPKENVIIGEIGNVIETDGNKMKDCFSGPAGKVLVDGLGVGDVGSIVLRDRKHLAQDGLIIVVVGIEKASNTIVSGPDIISRGFVYVRESEELIDTPAICWRPLLPHAPYRILESGIPSKRGLGTLFPIIFMKKQSAVL